MFRDPSKLKVFGLADEVTWEVYKLAASIAPEDRSGLDAQLRRAALAVPLRVIAGCRRGGDEAFLQGLSSAAEAASEGCYLAGLAQRMGLLTEEAATRIQERLHQLALALYGLRKAVSRPREAEATAE